MTRIILIGCNSRFPSAVARFGVTATYSGAVPECQPGKPAFLPAGDRQTQNIFRQTYPIAEAAGRPSKPAADLAGDRS